MAEYRFYQLTRQSLEQALPALLEKTLQRGWRAVVRADNPERLQSLDGHLWSYRDDSFLPHGICLRAQRATNDAEGKTQRVLPEDKFASEQPVLLTGADENPNGAQVLFLLDGLTDTALPGLELVCLIFSGADEAALGNARAAWSRLKAAGETIAYWQQTDSGGWEQKA